MEAKLRGVDLRFLGLTDLGCVPDYYTPVLITNERMIRERPDVVQRWVSAVARGYKFAIDKPGAAAEILINSVDGINADLVRASQPWTSTKYAEGSTQWGEQSTSVWDAYSHWMVDHGLQSRLINTAAAMDGSFIKNR